MTREEAIERIEAIKEYLTAGNPIWDNEIIEEACDLAIEALHMVSGGFGDYADRLWKVAHERGKRDILDDLCLCDDCIGRQAAIDACNNGVCACVSDCVDEINKLPSVRPEEKTGYWIIHFYECFPNESTIECSQCHEEQPFDTDRNYCPSCGAKMEGTGNGI